MVMSRDKDDGRSRRIRPLPRIGGKAPGNLQPAQMRHCHVEQDQIGREFADPLQRLFAICRIADDLDPVQPAADYP